MKNDSIRYLLILILLPFLLLTSCKKENGDGTPLNQFETLKSYMNENHLDILDLYGNKNDGTFWVIPGPSLGVDSSDYSLPNYYVIDLRSAEDFNKGHIKNAHNTGLANIFEEAENATNSKILVVCFTGQTAARATAALRLAGYSQSFCLQWGMCGWNEEFNTKWQSNAGDISTTRWNFDQEPSLGTFSYPEIITTEIDGGIILENRINELLSSDWTITNSVVLDSSSSYFIVNKWPLTDWIDYGHIAGAYRFDIDNGLSINELNKFDPNTIIALYCYNGQTSAFTTFWLQVIGYENARSLMYGANAIIHSDLISGSTTVSKSWQGAGSDSNLNYGYYLGDVYYPPSN